MRISQADWDALIAHAREEAPLECCGYARIDDGEITQIYRGQNLRQSAYGFQLDSASMFEAYKLEENGSKVAVYHSHPRSAAEPSVQDVNLGDGWNWLHLIVSLADDPHVRAWRIDDGRVEEETLEVG